MISIKHVMKIANRRMARSFSIAVKTQEAGNTNERNFEEEYKQFISSIPGYSDETYQIFMNKAQEAQNLDLAK